MVTMLQCARWSATCWVHSNAPTARMQMSAGAQKDQQKSVSSRRKTVSGRQERTKSRKARTKAGTSHLKTVSGRSHAHHHPRTARRKPQVEPWWQSVYRRLDGALVVGDIWMAASTQLSSSLIPAAEVPQHSLIAIWLWLAIAGYRGDFTSYERVSEEGSHIWGAISFPFKLLAFASPSQAAQHVPA